MSTGTIIYYSGFALLAITVLLAIVFVVKKSTYTPENARFLDSDDGYRSLSRGDSTLPVTKTSNKVKPVASTATVGGIQMLDSDDLPETQMMNSALTGVGQKSGETQTIRLEPTDETQLMVGAEMLGSDPTHG